MKLCTALILASMATAASAFSAVAPNVGNTEAVDKSLKGIDADESVFDPTGGDNGALIRNNNGEVWVPQVRFCFQLNSCALLCVLPFLKILLFYENHFSELVLVVTERTPPCEEWFARIL
jgi:hypothetical protein